MFVAIFRAVITTISVDRASNRINTTNSITEPTMPTATRTTKSFSLEKEVLKEVERTKGAVSTSERVNKLLKVGLEIERRQCLHMEAASFFAANSVADRTSRMAFQDAAMKSITRD